MYATNFDIIARIIHHASATINKCYLEQYEVEVTNDDEAKDIAKLFETCLGFEIVSDVDEYGEDLGGSILFQVRRTPEEQEKMLADFEAKATTQLEGNIALLKRSSDSSVKSKMDIEKYLKSNNLQWVLDKIKEIE